MFKGHPKGLIWAALSNMGERFGYYIMNAVLVLFLCSKFGLSDETAGLIFSVFYFMIYIMALPGGIVADKLQNYKGTIAAGLIVMAVGYVMLSIPTTVSPENKIAMLVLICAALLIITIGNGLFKGNLQAIVGQMYDNLEAEAAKEGPEALAKAQSKRDPGFQIFYVFINLGGVFAPFVAPAIRKWWLGKFGMKYNSDLPAVCHLYNKSYDPSMLDLCNQYAADPNSLTPEQLTSLTTWMAENTNMDSDKADLLMQCQQYITDQSSMTADQIADMTSNLQDVPQYMNLDVADAVKQNIVDACNNYSTQLNNLTEWMTKSNADFQAQVEAVKAAQEAVAPDVAQTLADNTAVAPEVMADTVQTVCDNAATVSDTAQAAAAPVIDMISPDVMSAACDSYLNVFNTGVHYSFIASVAAMLLSFIIFMGFKKIFPNPTKKEKKDVVNYTAEEKAAMAKDIKQRMAGLYAVLGIVVFFWFSFHQNTQSLTIFTRNFVNSDQVAPEVWQFLNPFLVIVLTPIIMWLFATKWGSRFSTPKKIVLGMGFAACAYIFLMLFSMYIGYPSGKVFMAQPADAIAAQKCGAWVLIVTYFFLTVAELFISPLGLSFVSKIAPKHLQGICQGLWLGATALGNLIIFLGVRMLNSFTHLWYTWLVFAVICLIAMLVMFGMLKWLERITSQQQ